MNKSRRYVLSSSATLGALSVSGCVGKLQSNDQSGGDSEADFEQPTWIDEINSVEMGLPSRPINQWPQAVEGDCQVSRDEIDSHRDIARSSFQGDEGYHALGTARDLLDIAVCIRERDSEKYLEKAEEITENFLNTAVQRDSAIYFPYTFDFPLHGYSDHKLLSPWFSGMAQGVALSAFSRLAELTDSVRYRNIADGVFKSFLHLRQDGEVVDPWVVTVDNEGYYWIEEYPEYPAAHTLNGKIFAIWGLYEYYQLTESTLVNDITKAAITTVLKHIDEFRVPGGVSYYCLGHKVQSGSYHMTHIRQLRKLHDITEIGEFSKYRSLFQSDHTE